MNQRPEISVLVAVYNGADFLKEAMDSILGQTFTDLEFILINDGSTDDTEAIISACTDKRLRYFRNEQNLGLTRTLNYGIELARGRYIARMDADDVSLPERLEKQYHYLEAHPEIAFCCSKAYTIDETGKRTGAIERVTGPEHIKVQLMFGNRFIHSSAFIRAEILKTAKYDSEFPYAHDFDLFVRLTDKYAAENLDEYLVLYREHQRNITHTRQREVAAIRRTIFTRQLAALLGPETAGRLIDVHLALCDWRIDRYPLADFRRLLESLKAGNQNTGKYHPRIFNKQLYDYWYELVRVKAGRKSLSQFFGSSLFENSFLTFKQLRKILKQSVGIQ